MAVDFSGLIGRLRAWQPELRGDFSAEWSSKSAGHREKIRQSVRAALDPSAGQLLDLAVLPDLPKWSISISHCPAGGGWVAVPKPARVGFDLEVTSRIQPHLIERISSAAERQLAPRLEYFWCAKESSFKALSAAQPNVITQIYIESWSDLNPGFLFSGRSGEYSFSGFASILDETVVSICVV